MITGLSQQHAQQAQLGGAEVAYVAALLAENGVLLQAFNTDAGFMAAVIAGNRDHDTVGQDGCNVTGLRVAVGNRHGLVHKRCVSLGERVKSFV